MSKKTGRNDPCPCGSGRKFKHCHGGPPAAPAAGAAPHENAASLAIQWLTNRHRKAFERATLDLLFEELWPEDGPHPEHVDPGLMGQVLINMNEWMLAHGEIEIRKQWQEINPLLLAPGGPVLGEAQRAFIRQLGERPLGLYSVVEVRRGEGVRLADALDADADPVFVHDRALSESARAGLLIGCRVLEFGDRLELSGAIYPFPPLGEGTAVDEVRAHLKPEIHPDDRAYEQGWAVMSEWLWQALMPPAIPELVDASTGERLLFVTDHYRVADADGLQALLDGCPDLEADGDAGWAKVVTGDDGVARAALHIHRGKVASRLEVFYRTQALADEGRAWFEALAGDAVRHLSREQTDPVTALREGLEPEGEPRPPAAGEGDAMPDLTPEQQSAAIEQVVRRIYANWADAPLPVLGNRTPREAIGTRAGLERVKGLLRSYADSEDERATCEKRRPVSFAFLWEALGLEVE